MATTVTYKGQTLATVENQTKVLETAGTWVEDDITLTDVSGGGGESDHWIRPSDWPNLSSLGHLTDQEIYFTYKTNDEIYSFAYFAFTVGSGKTVTVEEGQIVNGEFITSETNTLSNNSYFFKWLIGYNTDYTVFRITATGNITDILGFKGGVECDEISVKKIRQNLIEIYMSLPDSGTNPLIASASRFRYTRHLKSVTWFNCSVTAGLSRVFQDCDDLENAYIESSGASIDLYYTFATNPKLKYVYIYADKITNLNNAFNGDWSLKYGNWNDWKIKPSGANLSSAFQETGIESIDLTGWGEISVTNTNNMFNRCQNLKHAALSFVWTNGNAQNMFTQCRNIEEFPQLKGSFTNLTNVFSNCYVAKGVVDWSELDLTACTSFATPIAYSHMIEKVILPDGLPSIPAQAFRDMDMCREYHILATTPPTLANSNAFTYGDHERNMKIYVPYSEDHSVLAAYQSATNWSSLTDYLVEEDPS